MPKKTLKPDTAARPKLADIIRQFIGSFEKPITLEDLAADVGLTRAALSKWINANRFPRDHFSEFFSAMQVLGFKWPAQTPDALLEFYEFDLPPASQRPRQNPRPPIQVFWDRLAGSRCPRRFTASHGTRMFSAMDEHCLMMFFTVSVYPRFLRGGDAYSSIRDQFMGAVERGARFVVFAPTESLVTRCTDAAGLEGLHPADQFEHMMRECKASLCQGLTSKNYPDTAVEEAVHKQVCQVYCKDIMNTCLGRIVFLCMRAAPRKRMLMWGGERMADDTFTLYDDQGEFIDTWLGRLKTEAIRNLGEAQASPETRLLLPLKQEGAAFEKYRHVYEPYRALVERYGRDGVNAVLSILNNSEKQSRQPPLISLNGSAGTANHV